MEEVRYLGQLLADLFKNPQRRADSGVSVDFALPVSAGPQQVGDPAERAALSVGALMLLLIEERGGTQLPRPALERLASEALHGFDGVGRARINDEVTRIFDWLADTLLDKSEGIDPQSWGDVHYEIGPYVPLIKQAIGQGRDLEIEYFSYNRGEWTTRRVTPTRLEGRSTLVGHCHLRGTERRFRLSRIRSINLALLQADEPTEHVRR